MSGLSENFLENVDQEDFIQFRHIAISGILATDMSVHFSKLAQFNALSSKSGNMKLLK